MSDKKVHYQGKVDRCGVTRKIRFKSYGHAKWRAKEILRGEDNHSFLNSVESFRIYFCQLCGGFHFTSQPKRNQ